MPTPAGVKAYGTKLGYATTSGGTYTDIAHTRDIGSPGVSVGTIDVTSNDSPDNTKSRLPGMIDPGDFEFEIVYTTAAAGAVYGLLDASTVYSWKITYPDNSTFVFDGWLASLTVDGKTDDGALTAKAKISCTGKPVFSSGS